MTARWLILALFLVVAGCASAPAERAGPADHYREIVVPQGEQSPLVIVDDGSAAGAALVVRAKRIATLDHERAAWQQQSAGSQEVRAEMLDIMTEARADAVRQLEKARVATRSRSWGSGAAHLASADDSVATVHNALGAAIPDSIYCRTRISSVEDGSYIHYLPEGIYRDGGEDWISYTSGTKIKIGNYRFRVSSGETGNFDEKVTVLQYSFVHLLQPRGPAP